MKKIRLDTLLIEKKYFDSKQKAQSAIMNKIVKVNDKIIDKAGTMVKDDCLITITAELDSKYVSRGGFKLEKAIEYFKADIKDKIFLDIGASTGGFTDCLLKNGAKYVYAIDVGYGQINWSIRQNPNVKTIERCNARYLEAEKLYENPEKKAQGAVMDVSFISIEKIIPNLIQLLTNDFFIIALVKPQFEAGKENLKKGVVVSSKIHESVLLNFNDFCLKNKIDLIDMTYSPIKGPSGNMEFLVYLKANHSETTTLDNHDKILELVKTAHHDLKD